MGAFSKKKSVFVAFIKYKRNNTHTHKRWQLSSPTLNQWIKTRFQNLTNALFLQSLGALEIKPSDYGIKFIIL